MSPPSSRIALRLKFAWPWAAMLIAALYLYREAGHFVYAPRPGELGPDAWPRAIVVLLIVVCALRLGGYLLGFGVVAHGAAADGGDEGRPAVKTGTAVEAGAGEAEAGAADAAAIEPVDVPREADPKRYPKLLAAGIALTILYVLTMGTLGFLLATVLYLALFMLVGRYRRPGVIAISSIVGGLVFVYVFMKIVYVSLPLGTGPFEKLSLAVLAAIGVH